MMRTIKLLLWLLLLSLPSTSKALDCEALLADLERRFETAQTMGEKRKIERTITRVHVRAERPWWIRQLLLKDVSDIADGLQQGTIVKAKDMPGLVFSERMATPYSTPLLNQAMLYVRNRFFRALEDRNISTYSMKLVVTSVLRTKQFQRELITQGYPAAVRSSHNYHLAFDISYAWFEENAPEYARVLEEVLTQMRDEGKINLIKERIQQVWHIAISPQFQEFLQNDEAD